MIHSWNQIVKYWGLSVATKPLEYMNLIDEVISDSEAFHPSIHADNVFNG